MLGVLSIIAGLILVKHPFSALAVLVIIVGIWFIVVRRRALHRRVLGLTTCRGTNIAVGILDVLAGIVVLAWPDLSLKTLAVLAGSSSSSAASRSSTAACRSASCPKDPGGTGLAPAVA